MKSGPSVLRLFLAVSIIAGIAVLSCSDRGKSHHPTGTSTGTDTSTGTTAEIPWFTTRGGAESDEAWGVAVDNSGNIYWATHQAVPGPLADGYIYKVSPAGEVLWTTHYDNGWNEQLYIVDVNEPYVYVGGTVWTGVWTDSCDMLVLCLRTDNGGLVWDFSFDRENKYEEVDGLLAEDDGIYVAGWSTAAATSNDFAVLKLGLSGDLECAVFWGTGVWDEANGQIYIENNTIYVAGRYNAPGSLSGGDAVLAAFDKSDCSYKWHRTWGGAGLDDAFGLFGENGSIYVVGMTTSFSNGSQIFLIKYNLAGDNEWDALWGGSGDEAARTLAVGPEGDIFIAGKTTSYGAGQNDVAVIRYSPSGAYKGAEIWGGAGQDESHGCAFFGDWIYIAGETTSYGAGKTDAFLLKANAATGEFPTP